MAYACRFVDGTNITITGDGSDTNPYVINSSGGGGAEIPVQDEAPVAPALNDLWIDSDADCAGGGAPQSGTTVAARQGGSSTNWATAGTTTYTPDPTKTRVQAGVVSIPTISAGDGAGVPGQGQVTVTFPIAYANPPIVTVTNFGATVNGAHWSRVDATPTATSFIATVMNQSTIGTSTSRLAWIAVGEIA